MTRAFAAAVAAFLVVFTLLAVQLRRGDDPVLGATAAPPGPKRVLLKRVIKRKVVVTVRPAKAPAPDPAPVVSSSAPSSSAPASPAPAPAPSPPVATRSS